MSDLCVVAAGPADIEAVRTIFLEYERALGISLCFQGFEREVAELPGAYVPPRGALLLLKSGDALAGCVAMQPLSGDSTGSRCEMKRLYVRPPFRGRGGGRRLVDSVVALATEAGYSRLLLDTLEKLTEARALYARLGFREIPAYYENPREDVRFYALKLPDTFARTG